MTLWLYFTLYLIIGFLTMSWLIHRLGWPDSAAPTSDACLGVVVWPFIACAIILRKLHLGTVRALEWISGVPRQ